MRNKDTLNKAPALKIINRRLTNGIKEELWDCVYLIGDGEKAKAIFTDGVVLVVTEPECLPTIDETLIKDSKDADFSTQDYCQKFVEWAKGLPNHYIEISRNKLAEKFKEAKKHKRFETEPYRLISNPVATQVFDSKHNRYSTALLIDAAKLFKSDTVLLSVGDFGNCAVVTNEEKSTVVLVSPTRAYYYNELDEIPSVKCEDIMV